MIRDITIGQYYPAESRIHRLDPRVKIVCTLLYLISLFTFQSIIGYALATLFLVSCVKIAKVPFKYIMRGLKPIIILLMITVVFNLFLTPGGQELVHIGFLRVTERGLTTAVYMAIRMIYLIMGSSLMTLTTTPNALTDGIESLLKPLNKIHVPVHDIAMIMSIALRFIPILLEETDKIMKGHGSYPGASVCFCFPACQRPGHGHGIPLLPGRGRPDQNEAADLSGTGLPGVCHYGSLCGSSLCGRTLHPI